MNDADECPVCREAYTRCQRKRVECGVCDMAVCSSCLQTYLLTLQGDAQCMHCRRVLDGEFLATHLGKTWLLSRYKEHRERVLLDREMSLLPESQHILANYRRAEDLKLIVAALENERRALKEQLDDTVRQLALHRLDLDALRRNNYVDTTATTRDRRQFVRACPVAECRGFLSTAWKCGTCDARVCRHCGEPKERGEASDDEEDYEATDENDNARANGDARRHVCDPDVKASHAMLQRDSRPCPQCASMIYKIDGCFGADVLVRLWDGGVEVSQDVRVGDVLVGDDGTPRTVLSTCSGKDELFVVDQARGMSYVVNSKHTLLFRRRGVETEAVVGDYVATEGDVAWKAMGEETAFTVTSIGRGVYYGWMVDGNKRFLLADGTVARNCDQVRRPPLSTQRGACFDVRAHRRPRLPLCSRRCGARSATWRSAGARARW